MADNLASLRETSSKAMDAASMNDCIEKKNAAAAQVTGYYENHGKAQHPQVVGGTATGAEASRGWPTTSGGGSEAQRTSS